MNNYRVFVAAQLNILANSKEECTKILKDMDYNFSCIKIDEDPNNSKIIKENERIVELEIIEWEIEDIY